LPYASFFSPDYATARRRFLEAAARLSTRHQAYPFAGQGPNGEALTLDAVFLGAQQPERILILSSALHGVEGFLGSAVQLAWLETQAPKLSLPPATAIILVHALNPYGFAWIRRWNENNVDLNRNFLSDRTFLASDPQYLDSLQTYERLDSFLNPPGPPSPWEPYTLKAIGRILAEGLAARRRLPAQKRPSLLALRALRDLGLWELQKTLPVGQYSHPKGLFYGGTQMEATGRALQELLPGWLGGASLVLHVDFHTGLGKYADYRMLLEDKKDSPRQRWLSSVFGEQSVEPMDGATAYRTRGAMAVYLRDAFSGTHYCCALAEFGTYAGMRVLGSLRAENRAHWYAAPGSGAYTWAKKQLLEAFCPAAASWREVVIPKGLGIMDQAVRAISGSSVPTL